MNKAAGPTTEAPKFEAELEFAIWHLPDRWTDVIRDENGRLVQVTDADTGTAHRRVGEGWEWWV